MDRFFCGTRIVSGPDALSSLGEFRCRRLLMVIHPRLEPEIPRIKRAAGDPEIQLFSDVDPEPTMKQAVEGCRLVKDFRPDLIVTLGSRGILDCGKAMACFSGLDCSLAAIPAPFGGGSEITGRVLLTHDGRRHLLQNEAMAPTLAILDPSMTSRASSAEIAEQGFEILSAALEAYATGSGGYLGDFHAREGFSACWASLPGACSGQFSAIHRLQLSSALTGMAMEQGDPGLCRAMENSLGAVFGLSQGKAAAILLPAIIRCNAHTTGRRYAELSRAAGLGGSRDEIGIRNLCTGLIRLRQELGLPSSLVQAGIDIRTVWNRVREIVTLTLEDSACRNNPVTVDDFMVRRILEEITGRI